MNETAKLFRGWSFFYDTPFAGYFRCPCGERVPLIENYDMDDIPDTIDNMIVHAKQCEH